MKHSIFILNFLLIFASELFSQNYSVKSKKATEYFETALKYYESYNYEEALFFTDKALEKEPEFVEAYYLLSDIYTETLQFDKKISALKKAIEINPSKSGEAYISLAKTEMLNGKYSDAINHLNQLKNIDILKKYESQTQKYIFLCNYALELIKNPVEFKPENLGKNINSELDEYLPALSGNDNILIYTVGVPRQGITQIKTQNDTQEDFFLSNKLDDGTWNTAKNIGSPVNTLFNEGAQSISFDGKILFFTSCDNELRKNAHGKSFGSCDIFFSKKENNSWSEPQNVGNPVNSYWWESQPSFSSDGKTLFFVSNRPGGQGGIDIWFAKLKPDGTWSEVQNAGKNINTSADEQSPFIHPDNKTLYFSSNGHPGLGRSDLFAAEKDGSGNFGKAINLGYPINTWNEEFSLIVNSKGDKAYFSASYPEGFGGMDLYRFDMPEQIRPEPVYYIEGEVFDKETLKKLEANFYVFDLKNGDTITASISDAVSGEFLICIPQGNYAFNVFKEGYLFYSQNFSVNENGINQSSQNYLKIPLVPLKLGNSIVLNNVFFDTDSFVLKPESNVELNKISDLLIKNPKLFIEISGHTDNTGNAKHNKILSENRAKAVYEYLISLGILQNRMTFKGYGAEIPVSDNNSESGKALNRRTEIKITGI